MSSTDDASSRLSHALEAILSKSPTADWSVDDDDDVASNGGDTAAVEETSSSATPEDAVDETIDQTVDQPDAPYELPEIMPATAERPVEPAVPPPPPITPTLPPSPTTARTAPPAPTPAPTPPRPAVTEPVAAPPAVDARRAEPATAATSWADHMTSPVPGAAQGASLRTPGRRPRVRRVTRVLRHIDPWSTFKVGLLFSAVAYVVALTAGVLLWQVADSTGTLDNVERWFTQFGWETFELKGGEIFHNAWIIGLFGVVALTGGLVLLATLFNLVSDIVGGVRMTVLEEEVVERTITSTRRYVVRRPPLGAAGAADGWDVDDEDTPEAPNDPAPAGTDWSVDDDGDDHDDHDGRPDAPSAAVDGAAADGEARDAGATSPHPASG